MRSTSFTLEVVMFLVAGFGSSGFALTGPDTSDYVLVAYKISPAQESLFVRDGKVSAFWDSWDRANSGDSVKLDYVDLTVEKNAWVSGGGQFSGHDDAAVAVRAAYGGKGLYLYFGVTDDNWLQPAGYEADVLDFLLDAMNSDSIRACDPYKCYIQPSWSWSLTFSSIQYEISVGSGSVPSSITISYFDGACADCVGRRVPIEELAYGGMGLNVIRRSGNVNVLEISFPWTWVGASGGVGTMPDTGRRVALSPGYNDLDSGQATTVRTALRWKEKDPFNTCSDMTPPHDYCDAWGDIEFGPDLGSVVSVRPQSGHRTAVSHAKPVQRSANMAWYDLSGRRLGGATGSRASAHGVIVSSKTVGGGRLQASIGIRP
jgi:hypothetical protein